MLSLDEITSWFYSKKNSSWYKYEQPVYAYAYNSNYRINLINGEKEYKSIEYFQNALDKKRIFKTSDYHVIHFFYEWALWQEGLLLDSNELLAIEIQYKNRVKLKYENGCEKSKGPWQFSVLVEPDKKHYVQNLKKIQEDIKDGKYYQINYTQKWSYHLNKHVREFVEDFLKSADHVSPMAHITSIPYLKKIFLSNSPESLFVTRKNKFKIIVNTFPIKGTESLKQGIKRAKEQLSKSIKDLAELDMITDLLRNDLNRIQKPLAQVKKRRFYFSVPGILQQASWVQAVFENSLTLGDLIRALFPGGSITGAPKVATIKRIQSLEKDKREFYCGSTILHTSQNCAASINIRSATIDLEKNTLSYHAGGGITLKSNIENEWQEMHLKKNSFLKIWNGYEVNNK
jgi:anthranilate/para-aminobenzoate synthase component I